MSKSALRGGQQYSPLIMKERFGYMEQKKSTSGSVKISVGVVRTIVQNVLAETEGVHSLAARGAHREAIEVSLEAEIAVIDIAVNLCYGCKIKEVARQIQSRVKDAVQDMTGMAVSRVNVLVADIRE